MSENLFRKPAYEWTRDELRVGLQELAKMIQWHDDQRQFDKSADLRAVWEVLDAERRKWVAIAREVEDALNPVKVRAPARILRSPAERRAMRRRRRVE